MELISESMARIFLSVYLADKAPQLDHDSKTQKTINEIKKSPLNSQNASEIMTYASLHIEELCAQENYNTESLLNVIAELAYLTSRAFESKVGNLTKVFLLLVEVYNKNRQSSF